MLETIRRHRRALHRIPEVWFDLPETQAYVLAHLEGLGARVKALSPSGVLAWFDAGRAETTAFRCDMDALPIQEAAGCPFASEHPGRMHACGHDAHMATMLAFCEWLSGRVNALPCNVLVIFQPAEESGGGARLIVESGALEEHHVRRIFAMHVQPGIDRGVLCSRPGAFMATSSEVHIRLTGASAHAARAREGRDAMLAGAEAVRNVYAFDASLPADMPRLVRLCSFHAGNSTNIVPDAAELSGTARAFSREDHARIKEGIRSAVCAACAPLGVEAEVAFGDGYPPTVNDEALFARFRAATCGLPFRLLPAPDLTTEDFAFYLERVPGMMFYLGTGSNAPLHSPLFTLDEEALMNGLEAFCRLAMFADWKGDAL